MESHDKTKHNTHIPQSIGFIFDRLGEVDLYSSFLEENPHPILVTDTQGIIVYANAKMIELCGYSKTELTGQSSAIFNSGHQPESFYKNMWEKILAGNPFEDRFKNRHKNGSTYWVYSTIRALRNCNGEVRGYVSIQEDITNLVKIESKSITDEVVLLNLVRNLPKTGIVIYNIAEQETYMAEGEIIHELFSDRTPSLAEMDSVFSTDNYSFGDTLQQADQTGDEIKQLVKLGGRTIDLRVSVLTFGPGAARNVLLIIKDVTDYQNIIENVERSEQQLEAIFQNAGIGIGIINTQGNYIRLNHGWADMVGFSVSEVLEKNVKQLLYKDDYDHYQPELQKLINGERAEFRAEMRFVRKNNKILWADVSMTTLRDSVGEIELVIAVAIDITEKIHALRALQNSEHELSELNATKDRFFSILAHDLKNPFNSIIGLSELATFEGTAISSEKAAEYFEAINTTANHAYSILENLLDWSRIQTNTIKPQLKQTDIYLFIVDTVELLSTMANKKNVSIKYAGATRAIAFCDSNMMQTVFRNLLSNAIKFSNSGGTITVKITVDTEIIRVAVADNGVGMTSEQIDRLFAQFIQQSTPGTDNEKGTGLGFGLINDFVKMNNGKVNVESELHKGSTFTVTIPRAQT
ncbi:MAG: PAS domain-containing sensor histidine kinase [Salinivirgaceae bacterium]|jgi:PAS domain S-box-containing protein|nr:PAS domain-containing sensor histidine kinase [Salinivirgaceae bacterium]